MLEIGADPTIMNRTDSTCLHQAAANCDLRMVQELLKHKIDVCDSNDRTALMLNAMNDNIDSQIATALISAGADHSYPGDKVRNCHIQGDRTPYKVAKENEWIHIMELLETEENTTIIPLHMTIGKNTVKNGTKPIKRIPVKRKPQPLTPPHSDGCMSTPSPHDAFQLARPVGSVLDSPVSEHLGSINNAFSPTDNGISMTRPSYWTNDVSASSTTKHSPPYDYPDLGASSYYSNYSLQYNSSSSYSSSQSYQPGPSNTTKVFRGVLKISSM
uniref:ANK_REP_REGION domain-containing protein n=1 Tax=Heterorhabditis bacteriophora TaxID=37862 RepID=A0A1I7X3G6_HETBA